MKLFYCLTRCCFSYYFSLFHHHKVFGSQHLPKGPCILAPNHASFYDPPLMSISCKDEIHFLARGSLFNQYFFKIIISHLNAYPITGTTQDLSSIKLILQLIKDQKKVVVFPEGIRSFDGHLSPIKSGIGMLAIKCNCQIVPVYIHGTFEVWPRTRKFPRISGETACVFGSPISPDSFSKYHKKEAQQKIAQHVQRSIEALRQWYLDGAKNTPP